MTEIDVMIHICTHRNYNTIILLYIDLKLAGGCFTAVLHIGFTPDHGTRVDADDLLPLQHQVS